jgi:hypothetical protein
MPQSQIPAIESIDLYPRITVGSGHINCLGRGRTQTFLLFRLYTFVTVSKAKVMKTYLTFPETAKLANFIG